MKYLIVLMLCCWWIKGNSQQCGCEANFRHMVAKVKTNYVGYQDKVSPQQEKRFLQYTDSLQQVAAITGWQDCFLLLRSWLLFFKDQHMSLTFSRNGALNKDSIRAIFAGAEKVEMTAPDFKTYINQDPGTLDSIEGIWTDEFQSVQIGFMRDKVKKDEFIGVILKADSVLWLPGQIKARVRKKRGAYEMLYLYNREHVPIQSPLALNNHMMNVGIAGILNKIYPEGTQPVSAAKVKYYTPSFKVLDEQTCLLVMPSFRLEAKPLIDSLIDNNMDIIRRSKNFILDLRNNTGGSVLCFEKLLPIIYTNPIITKGAAVLATEDNIREYYSITDYPNISDSMKAVFRQELEELKAHKGSLYNLWKNDTLVLNEIMPTPQKVSVIINRNCASSAEIFLLKARQSSKVTIYGKNSMGAVDYSDVATTNMPCNYFILRYPTSRTNRLPEEPIDNIGIKPHVKIPDNVVDWVEFVKIKVAAENRKPSGRTRL
ncbi:S41 family peptidase [Chitinophaga nivalis]|uniref:S41 family peptidase n=1 Tax=Chitinophaga nivalis TaxID=2991709 RepID=A0ABT3IGT8_9BACT|nr:S41 family peptidase [Chitinophaga nivalis]MCW3467127.1 S41 family peptidase [Chitinophaga nivalis]MCW3483182.1 S41 family peptidase [Chitinophaga nivalis]